MTDLFSALPAPLREIGPAPPREAAWCCRTNSRRGVERTQSALERWSWRAIPEAVPRCVVGRRRRSSECAGIRRWLTTAAASASPATRRRVLRQPFADLRALVGREDLRDLPLDPNLLRERVRLGRRDLLLQRLDLLIVGR